MVTPVPKSAGRCRLRGRLWPIGHPRLRLCERLGRYHKLGPCRRCNKCGGSGRCDGHSLLTGFPEITFANKPFFAWYSVGVSIVRLLRALCDVILVICSHR